MQSSKKKTVLILLACGILIASGASALGFLFGYRQAETEWKKTYALNALNRMSTDLKVAKFLMSNKTEGVKDLKDLLDSDLDTNLTYVMEYDSLLSSDIEFPRYSDLRNREIRRLKIYWSKNEPFVGKAWEPVTSSASWIELRKKHQEFIDSIAQLPEKEKE